MDSPQVCLSGKNVALNGVLSGSESAAKLNGGTPFEAGMPQLTVIGAASRAVQSCIDNALNQCFGALVPNTLHSVVLESNKLIWR